MAGALEAARTLAQMGWPVLPVAPGAKQPLTSHGVQDATTDTNRLEAWWQRWPDANVGVACGHPGPQVLDIDDLQAAQDMLPKLEATGAPEVATPRGRHLYFAGNTSGTIALGYGELRGAGSYVVAPPSVHPSGKEYVWLVEPHLPLPKAPGDVAGDRKGKGAGQRPVVERVSHGQRHDHLVDLAVRLVRSGVVEQEAIERALVAEYEAVCDKKPAALPMYFTKIAKWAVSSNIADRERERKAAQEPAEIAPERKRKSRKKRQLPYPPERDAPLTDLRAFVCEAMGLPDVIRVDEVVRYGPRTGDALIIRLSNGVRVVFDAQGDVTAPRTWRDTIQSALAGVAKTPTYTGAELGDVHWALCVLSTTTEEQRFEDELQDLVRDLLDLAEPLHGTIEQVEPRYDLLGALLERAKYDATDRGNAAQPTLVVDTRTGKRYVRSVELQSLAWHRRLGIATALFAGRMRMVGLERRIVQARGDQGHRKQVLYELPEGESW